MAPIDIFSGFGMHFDVLICNQPPKYNYSTHSDRPQKLPLFVFLNLKKALYGPKNSKYIQTLRFFQYKVPQVKKK